MESEISFVTSGTITTPASFLAGATAAGIKTHEAGAADLGILYSETAATAAGVFTINRIKAAPLLVTAARLPANGIRALVVNSGCANTAVGEVGKKDAIHMTELAAAHTGVAVEAVLVASTGVIGCRLPMPLIEKGVGDITLSREGGHHLAEAIMTTDTVPKEAAVTVNSGGISFSIGGIAKGSGMIHPDMATLLGFLTTDAAVSRDFLAGAIRTAAAISFNMVSIDGDTSPNDMVIILANGRAGNEPITPASPLADVFQEALNQACIRLAQGIARDGEGATRLIEVTISGAASITEARAAARTIVGSALVKTAAYGNDPNWGRIIAALGRSGVTVTEASLELYLNGTCLLRDGCPLPFDREEMVSRLKDHDVDIKLELNQGTASATAWGCDLSQEYVIINSAYTT